jgi:hypothetical protein
MLCRASPCQSALGDHVHARVDLGVADDPENEMEIAVFGNTQVKTGVRIAAVTLGVAAAGLLGAPIASAAMTLPVQATTHMDGGDPLLGSLGGVVNLSTNLNLDVDADVDANVDSDVTANADVNANVDVSASTMASTHASLTGE